MCPRLVRQGAPDKTYTLNKDEAHTWKIKAKKGELDGLPRVAYVIFRAIDELQHTANGDYRAGVLQVLPVLPATKEAKQEDGRSILDAVGEQLCFGLPATDPANPVGRQIDYLREVVGAYQPLQLLCGEVVDLSPEEIGKQAGLLLSASRQSSSSFRNSDIVGCWERMAQLLDVAAFDGSGQGERLDGGKSFERCLQVVLGSGSDAVVRLLPWMRCLDVMLGGSPTPEPRSVPLEVLNLLVADEGQSDGYEVDPFRPPIAESKTADPVASSVFNLMLQSNDRSVRLRSIFELVGSLISLPLSVTKALNPFVHPKLKPSAESVFEVLGAVLEEEAPDDPFSKALQELDIRRLLSMGVAYEVAKGVGRSFRVEDVGTASEDVCKAERDGKQTQLPQSRKHSVMATMRLIKEFAKGLGDLSAKVRPLLDYLHDKVKRFTYSPAHPMSDTTNEIKNQLVSYGRGHPILPMHDSHDFRALISGIEASLDAAHLDDFKAACKALSKVLDDASIRSFYHQQVVSPPLNLAYSAPRAVYGALTLMLARLAHPDSFRSRSSSIRVSISSRLSCRSRMKLQSTASSRSGSRHTWSSSPP